MPLTKKAEDLKDFYHATSRDNFEKILASGKLRPPSRLANHAQGSQSDVTINIEPNRWSRVRSEVPAEEAVELLRGERKLADKVFLSQGGAVRGYGDYIIHKRLKSPSRSKLLNLVPKEHVSGRDISVRSNARLIVPPEEIEALKEKFPRLRGQFRSSEEEKYPVYSRRHAFPELPGKLVNSVLSKKASEITQPAKPGRAGLDFNVKEINPRAMLGGSSAIGIGVDGVQDIDVSYPSINNLGL